MRRVGQARRKYGFSERGRPNVKCNSRKTTWRPREMRCVRKRMDALRAASDLAAFCGEYIVSERRSGNCSRSRK